MINRERIRGLVDRFELDVITPIAVASYGLRAGFASYFHPDSINNPNIRNRLYELSSHVKVTFAPEIPDLKDTVYFFICGPYVVDRVGKSTSDYMGAIAQGFLAVDHQIDLIRKKRKNQIRVVTRDGKYMVLPAGFEPVSQATFQTKTLEDGKKVFKNKWVEWGMKGHVSQGGCVAVFPSGTTENFGMVKSGINPITALSVYKNNLERRQKTGLGFIAFITDFIETERVTKEVVMGKIDLPIIQPESREKLSKRIMLYISELTTQYALAKIAQAIDGKVPKEQKGEYQNPDQDIIEILTRFKELQDEGVVITGGFISEERTRLGINA